LAIRNGEEEKLVTIANGSNELGMIAPINTSNSGFMSGQFTE
jgi:hypothetical protein